MNKKVSFNFDQLGRLIVKKTETMEDGKVSRYSLEENGDWTLVNPGDEFTPCSQFEILALASTDPATWIDPADWQPLHP